MTRVTLSLKKNYDLCLSAHFSLKKFVILKLDKIAYLQ